MINYRLLSLSIFTWVYQTPANGIIEELGGLGRMTSCDLNNQGIIYGMPTVSKCLLLIYVNLYVTSSDTWNTWNFSPQLELQRRNNFAIGHLVLPGRMTGDLSQHWWLLTLGLRCVMNRFSASGIADQFIRTAADRCSDPGNHQRLMVVLGVMADP